MTSSVCNPGSFRVQCKVLNGKLLGQVRINRGVNDPANFLKAQRLVYFTNKARDL